METHWLSFSPDVHKLRVFGTPAKHATLCREHGNDAVRRILAPYTAWDPTYSFGTNGGGRVHVTETAVHELGHLFHLEAWGIPDFWRQEILSEPKMGKTDVMQDGLTRYIDTLSPEEQRRTEREARATNQCVAQMIPGSWQWVRDDSPVHVHTSEGDSWRFPPGGPNCPTDRELAEQMLSPTTQAIAARVLDILLRHIPDLGQKARPLIERVYDYDSTSACPRCSMTERDLERVDLGL